MKGKLILEDGSVFHGELLNNIKATGEVVFNTGMVGYQESLTDPSYCRQILTLTYPMVGNYGIADIFMQSRKSFVNGFIIGELCEHGSNWHYETSLADFLTKQGVPCLYNVDTRAVTRKIRNAGTMKGIIVPEDAAQTEIDELFAVPIKKDVVMEVTTPEAYTLESEKEDAPFVVAMDFGVKQNIIKSMHDLGFKITVVPAHTTAEEVLAMNPDGVFLSNGPGDPADVPEIVEEVKKLIGAYAAVMGGVDAIIFTAGVGENSASQRLDIASGLEFMGVKMDAEANNVRGKEAVISAADSKVKVLLIPTNEELMIAMDTASIVKG